MADPVPIIPEPPAIAFHNEKKLWLTLDKQALIDALHDPRIPSDAEITRTANYPGLAILAPQTPGDAATLAYIGYIDLFDGSVVINPEPRMNDGKNPLTVEASGNAPSVYSEKWVGAK